MTEMAIILVAIRYIFFSFNMNLRVQDDATEVTTIKISAKIYDINYLQND